MIATLRLRTAVAKKCDEEARRAPTYFTDRLKCPTFLTNFSKKIVHHATCLATPQSVSLAQKWVAVKAMYRIIGDEYIGKPPRGHKPWMSNNTWTHIQERADIKANINAASSVARLAELRTLSGAKNKTPGDGP